MHILVIAPHADDETLGMGGTIARYAREGHEVIVAVLTGHGDDARHPIWPRESWDIVRSELRKACDLLGVRELILDEVPAVMVADQPVWKLNKLTQELVTRVAPDRLYLPFLNDLHKDHRECFHSFAVASRPYTDSGKRIREVYAYEVPSETHLSFPYVEQGFLPNTWVDISAYLEVKLKAAACYTSQIQPHPSPRSIESLDALAVWRGSQIGVAAAEAFVLVRSIA
jgi:LmbE family N-acetylglucosaminyl deacetylase